MEENRPSVRAMLAFENDDAASAALEEARRHGRCQRVTIAAVAAPPHVTLPWAALAGVSPDDDRRAAIAAARRGRRPGRLPDRRAGSVRRRRRASRRALLADPASCSSVGSLRRADRRRTAPPLARPAALAPSGQARRPARGVAAGLEVVSRRQAHVVLGELAGAGLRALEVLQPRELEL